jgi:DNA-binding GntR family transcriptional regulator
MEVRRDCIRAQIRRVLLTRILDGTYRPGDRLKELQIAREFQTSQGPVREALRELETLRLVESQTYRGTRVRAAEVRGVLEQAAAAKAAGRLKGNAAPLHAELDALRAAAATGDLDAYSRCNMAFHRRIVEASGNAVMLRVWDSLMLEVRTRIGLNQLDLDLPAVAETHLPIVEALERGDGERAGSLLRAHAEMFIPDPTRPGEATGFPSKAATSTADDTATVGCADFAASPRPARPDPV